MSKWSFLKNIWIIFLEISIWLCSLHNLGNSLLLDIQIVNIFSHPLACLFIFLVVSFDEQRFWNFMEVQINTFLINTFCILRTLRVPQSHEYILLYFLEKIYRFDFYIQKYNSSPLWYHIWCKVGVQVFFFSPSNPGTSAPFMEYASDLPFHIEVD